MATATIQDMTCEELWYATRDVVVATVRKFRYRYGGDLEDLMSEAHQAFMKGFGAIQEGKHNSEEPTVEIKRWIWYELFDSYRTRMQLRRKKKTVIQCDEFIDQRPNPTPRRGVVDLLEQVSADARMVLQLTLDAPAELAAAADRRGGTPRNFRKVLRMHLAEDLGWAASRIGETLEEIKAAL